MGVYSTPRGPVAFHPLFHSITPIGRSVKHLHSHIDSYQFCYQKPTWQVGIITPIGPVGRREEGSFQSSFFTQPRGTCCTNKVKAKRSDQSLHSEHAESLH